MYGRREYEMPMLQWPYEGAVKPEVIEASKAGNLSVPGFSVVDAHGDPILARLKIFSDGNHHMALEAACRRFLDIHPEANDIFYTTAPAGTVKDAFQSGVLRLGNLSLTVRPNVFLGPRGVVGPLHEAGKISEPRPFARSRGSVLLVRKGNPLGVATVTDLLRDDVRVVCSNPTKEKASFGVYSETLCNLARSEEGDAAASVMLVKLRDVLAFHSGMVHHREIPQIIASGEADVAPLYYHLALRYVTIFPDLFEFVPLGGTVHDPRPGPEHKLNTYFVSVVKNDEGDFGEKFAEFMMSPEVADIYQAKGLESLLPSEC